MESSRRKLILRSPANRLGIFKKESRNRSRIGIGIMLCDE
jgi:hypothetical protein